MSKKVTSTKTEKYDEYDVGYDLDTLIKASTILDDKSKLPKLKAEHKRRQDALLDVGKELALESKTKKSISKLLGEK